MGCFVRRGLSVYLSVGRSVGAQQQQQPEGIVYAIDQLARGRGSVRPGSTRAPCSRRRDWSRNVNPARAAAGADIRTCPVERSSLAPLLRYMAFAAQGIHRRFVEIRHTAHCGQT